MRCSQVISLFVQRSRLWRQLPAPLPHLQLLLAVLWITCRSNLNSRDLLKLIGNGAAGGGGSPQADVPREGATVAAFLMDGGHFLSAADILCWTW